MAKVIWVVDGHFHMQELEVRSLEAAYEDERGAIYDLLDGEEVRHIGLITCTEDAIRGNHYHEEQKQWMYITEGSIDLYLKDVRGDEGGEVERTKMVEGELIYIPPKVVHTIEAKEYTVFLDFNDQPRGDEGQLYEEDTVRVDDITG